MIDLFGTASGLIEFKASLLASRGIMTLALAYFNFEDLPDSYFNIEVDYFRVRFTILSYFLTFIIIVCVYVLG